MECQAGWITCMNQDFWEKYQQFQICMWYHFNDSKEELKSLLKRVKEESERASLKLNTKITMIMIFDSISSRQIREEKGKTVTAFIFLGSKITVASQVVLVVKNLPAKAGDMRHGFDPWVRKIWRKTWQSTPGFLPGESQKSLEGYSPWSFKESDTTEAT